MASLKLWARHGEAVRQAIELGAIAPIETAREECTDAVLWLAIDSGLLQRWAGSLARATPCPSADAGGDLARP